ncbi:imidazole glycerol phosphate synthase subunit HisH [Lactococcus cremoris]|uniref:imidazole glycerol phosphate synthase subunit HisH n=1 Tax=Lactococcus lactis subsp. cremoris TaxID=1359 RepID=UPI000BDED986|nr:imidazole glycerol phosphate synthase subunit HisH [Lactococcus cremoris]
MKNIIIIDYNVGNLQSVEAAFTRLGMTTTISRDHDTIRQADAIILPGVGSFPVAMSNLTAYNLVEILRERATAGVPFLGICLGMQVLFDKGFENGETPGLGLLTGTVDPIKTDEKLPHMGWNQLKFNQPNHPLLSKITEGDEVYFVHSYQANCPSDEVIATTTYGKAIIPAIVGKNNVLGCQFHPEKSGEVGRQILTVFKEII